MFPFMVVLLICTSVIHAQPPPTTTEPSMTPMISYETTVWPRNWQPGGNDLVLRKRLATCMEYLSDVLHDRYHELQDIGNPGELKEGNWLMNPAELTTIFAVMVNGMDLTTENICDLSRFLGLDDAEVDFPNLFLAIQGYLFYERYEWYHGRPLKILMDNAVFLNRNFSLFENFVHETEIKYASTFRNFSNDSPDFIGSELKKYITKMTGGLITDINGIDRTDFEMMIVGTTYVHGRWLRPFKTSGEKPKKFTCFGKTRYYKMRVNTQEFQTYYIDYPDKYVVFLPFEPRDAGMILYVPKTLEHFQFLDNNMTNLNWNEVQEDMTKENMFHVKITFPLFKMGYERNITYDMERLNISFIFRGESITFDKMTAWKKLNLKEVHQKTFITVKEENVTFASVSYITIRNNTHKDIVPSTFYGNCEDLLPSTIPTTHHPMNYKIDDTKTRKDNGMTLRSKNPHLPLKGKTKMRQTSLKISNSFQSTAKLPQTTPFSNILSSFTESKKEVKQHSNKMLDVRRFKITGKKLATTSIDSSSIATHEKLKGTTIESKRISSHKKQTSTTPVTKCKKTHCKPTTTGTKGITTHKNLPSTTAYNKCKKASKLTSTIDSKLKTTQKNLARTDNKCYRQKNYLSEEPSSGLLQAFSAIATSTISTETTTDPEWARVTFDNFTMPETPRQPPDEPPHVIYVDIDRSFFYALVNQHHEIYFTTGKVYYCPDDP